MGPWMDPQPQCGVPGGRRAGRKVGLSITEYPELGGAHKDQIQLQALLRHPNNPTLPLRALSKHSWSPGSLGNVTTARGAWAVPASSGSGTFPDTQPKPPWHSSICSLGHESPSSSVSPAAGMSWGYFSWITFPYSEHRISTFSTS